MTDGHPIIQKNSTIISDIVVRFKYLQFINILTLLWQLLLFDLPQHTDKIESKELLLLLL